MQLAQTCALTEPPCYRSEVLEAASSLRLAAMGQRLMDPSTASVPTFRVLCWRASSARCKCSHFCKSDCARVSELAKNTVFAFEMGSLRSSRPFRSMLKAPPVWSNTKRSVPTDWTTQSSMTLRILACGKEMATFLTACTSKAVPKSSRKSNQQPLC